MEVTFPQVLADVAVLQAKHAALEGAFFQLVEKVDPEGKQHWGQAYENMYKRDALRRIYEIPQVDAALREDLKRQLGL